MDGIINEVTKDSVAAGLQHVIRVCRSGQLSSAAPVLPLLFSLYGKPYTLAEHFVFEEMYTFVQPPQMVFMTGRQVGKSTNLAVQSILLCSSAPFMTVVFVTPLAEQARRLSTMYIATLLDDSPIGKVLVTPGMIRRVLHRDFSNRSRMLFTYAFRDATRVRGLPGSRLVIDEAQDILIDLLPVIREVISHSQFGQLELCSGTPKTWDNTLAAMWQDSSQAEWFIPCSHCTTGGFPTWNIPSPDFHLERMLGPQVDDISERYPGTICHKCGQPISPRQGRWVHRYPERRWRYPGYHVSQPIMPYYYANPENWGRILAKQRGVGPTPINMFYNEVLGWPYDLAANLLTEKELREAAILGPNTVEHAMSVRDSYATTVLGIDWGGGGERGISLTTLSLAGMRYDGKIDVIWGIKLLTPHDHIREAINIFDYYRKLRPNFIAHDYAGGGAIRETLLVQAGISTDNILPMVYTMAPARFLCVKQLAHGGYARDYFMLDKTRAIQLVCNAIRVGIIHFFDYDYISPDAPGLLRDFLALSEEKISTKVGEVYRVTRHPSNSDDFAQATTYACCGLWQVTQKWPDLVRAIDEKYGAGGSRTEAES